MKKIYLFFLIFPIIFVACKKNKDAEISRFSIQNENIVPSSTTMELSCDVVCSATIKDLYLQYGTKADLSKCEEVRMKNNGDNRYSVTINSLTANTTYYVRYLAVNSYSSMMSKEITKFKTLTKSEPDDPDNPDDIPTEMYMIGSDYGNWDWYSEGIVSLIPVHSAEGAFWTIKPLKAGKQFKFCSKKEWNGDFNSLGEDSGYVVVDGNCSVESDGIYMIYVDVKNKKLVIEPAAVYGIGDCFGSWDEAMRSAKFAVSEDGKVLIMTVPASGNLRMYAESSVATTDWWTREFNVYDGKIKFRGIGVDLDAVEVKAGQVVTINFADNTATIIGKQYTITVASNNSSYGSVSGGGTYEEGTRVILRAIANSGYRFVRWNDGNTDNPRVITVTKDESYTAVFEKFEPEYVDLGLPSGLKWATCNVGATKPEEYGDYFAWGEVEPKEIYNWSTYKYGTDYLTKYCNMSSYGKNGFTDNKTILDSEDDAATANWGGVWRMPTKVEQDELRNNCTWTWTTQNGVNGYKVVGPNGNSIFLPAAGVVNGGSRLHVGSGGRYWSNSLFIDDPYLTDNPYHAYYVFFESGYVDYSKDSRYYGHSVRPVYAKYSYTITVSASSSSYGTVSGGGTYEEGTQVTLTATAKAGYKFTEWNDGNTDNPRVITVTQDESYTAYFEVEETMNAGHEYVDLGLPSGVKWATCNVGANSPEEYGDYFAWGETKPKEIYDWSTYKYCNGSSSTLIKYCDDSSYGNNGFTDNKTVLDPEDDAAHVNWGGAWRMPTHAEQSELRNNCTWNWTTQNGVNGCKVTGPNGNSIFLPAAGCMKGGALGHARSEGDYWSSSQGGVSYAAYGVFFSSDNVNWLYYTRYFGQSVRPVCQ